MYCRLVIQNCKTRSKLALTLAVAFLFSTRDSQASYSTVTKIEPLIPVERKAGPGTYPSKIKR